MSRGWSTWVRQNVQPAFIPPDERRERYEQRLALEWCRARGSPHLGVRTVEVEARPAAEYHPLLGFR